jgi:hypothetical protein
MPDSEIPTRIRQEFAEQSKNLNGVINQMAKHVVDEAKTEQLLNKRARIFVETKGRLITSDWQEGTLWRGSFSKGNGWKLEIDNEGSSSSTRKRKQYSMMTTKST